MLTTRFPFAASGAALLFAVVTGCGSDTKSDESSSFETDPSLLRAALENPIISCQEARRECRADAEDAEGRAACNDELASCLQTAAEKAQATATALRQCRDDARSCVSDGGDRAECRSTYETCTDDAINGDGPTSTPDAGVDSDDAGSDDSDDDSDVNVDAGILAGLPKPGKPSNALPSLPGPNLDGGILAGLPKPELCVIELRLCLFGDPAKAMECGDEARVCLKP
jgi:hypothetical protein